MQLRFSSFVSSKLVILAKFEEKLFQGKIQSAGQGMERKFRNGIWKRLE